MEGVMMTVASTGNIGLLQLVYMEYSKLNSKDSGLIRDLINAAASNGHLTMVQWLVDYNLEVICDLRSGSKAMNNAAGNGHLDAVKWLHENYDKGCKTDAMDFASSNGHLDVVKWLHENRTEGCTTKAIDLAAKNGHLYVVQWLHQNRVEECTTKAMDRAAWKGHLDVVQWLNENRTEGCDLSGATMLDAAMNGRLCVIRFLYLHCNEGRLNDALRIAKATFDFEMYQWL